MQSIGYKLSICVVSFLHELHQYDFSRYLLFVNLTKNKNVSMDNLRKEYKYYVLTFQCLFKSLVLYVCNSTAVQCPIIVTFRQLGISKRSFHFHLYCGMYTTFRTGHIRSLVRAQSIVLSRRKRFQNGNYFEVSK